MSKVFIEFKVHVYDKNDSPLELTRYWSGDVNDIEHNPVELWDTVCSLIGVALKPRLMSGDVHGSAEAHN